MLIASRLACRQALGLPSFGFVFASQSGLQLRRPGRFPVSLRPCIYPVVSQGSEGRCRK
jgi:hypothetical protein